MLPKPLPEQIPDQWEESERTRGEVIFRSDDKQVRLLDYKSGHYAVKLVVNDDVVASNPNVENGEIALATAVGFMEMSDRLYQSYLS